jgi:hypothetical protein
VPDADAMINNSTLKSALKKAYSKSIGVAEGRFTKFELSAFRRLQMSGNATTAAIKVYYEVDLTGVSNAAMVVAEAKAMPLTKVTESVRMELKAVKYPRANGVVVASFTATQPVMAATTGPAAKTQVFLTSRAKTASILFCNLLVLLRCTPWQSSTQFGVLMGAGTEGK